MKNQVLLKNLIYHNLNNKVKNMSEDIRKMIDRVKNIKEFVNENEITKNELINTEKFKNWFGDWEND